MLDYYIKMSKLRNKEYDHLFKFVMVGNSAVGKSSLLLRYADNQFNENYMITIGVDFRFKSLRIDDKIVKLQIWDTAGQQRFRTIVNTYYKNSQAVFMIFDFTNKESFNDIKSFWINEVESYTQPDTMLILVGNKSDCQRVVSEQTIRNFITQKNIAYFQTSAKTGQNVQELFNATATNLLKQGKFKQREKINIGTTKLEEASQSQFNNSGKKNCNC